MEQSKSISLAIAKLKIAYPYYFEKMNNEADENYDPMIPLVSLYQENLSCYNAETLANAINRIIKNNKFMPTIAEIVEMCEKEKVYKRNSILELMKNDGYFRRSDYGKLSTFQEEKNYNKALMWAERNVIPEWLIEDMKFYNSKLIEAKNVKKLME